MSITKEEKDRLENEIIKFNEEIIIKGMIHDDHLFNWLLENCISDYFESDTVGKIFDVIIKRHKNGYDRNNRSSIISELGKDAEVESGMGRFCGKDRPGFMACAWFHTGLYEPAGSGILPIVRSGNYRIPENAGALD